MESLYTNITKVNLSVFVYRLFHEDFSPLLRAEEAGDNTVLLLCM